MKAPFVLLVLGLVAIYVLMASNAVVFENNTLEQTGLVDRVVMMPTFHPDRLTAYFEQRWEGLQNLPARLFRPRAGL